METNLPLDGETGKVRAENNEVSIALNKIENADLGTIKKEKSAFSFSRKPVYIVTTVFFIIAIVSLFLILTYDRIYPNICITGINVSGLNKKQATDIIEGKRIKAAESAQIKLKTSRHNISFKLADIGIDLNVDKAVDEAFSKGREGWLGKRLFDISSLIFTKADIRIKPDYDKDLLNNYTERFYIINRLEVMQPVIKVIGKNLYIKTGTHGETIIESDLRNRLYKNILKLKNAEIFMNIDIIEPDILTADDIIRKYTSEPVEAKYVINNGSVDIVPHLPGVYIDKKRLEYLLNDLYKNEGSTGIIRMEIKNPERTAELLSSSLFKDVLSYKNSRFGTSNTNDKNRGINIKLVVAKINNIILAPGQVFSFNEIVGRRTEEGGYKIAHAYVEGKIVDGIGGGICQVSSTLYNAVLVAELPVKERFSHMFTVGYVPYGLDATVNYGTKDFKFVNNTGYPVQINANVTKNNMLEVTLIGTDITPDRTVELITSTQKVIPYKTIYIQDNKLSTGKKIIEQKGKTGYLIDVFVRITQNGKEVSYKKLNTNYYMPLDQKIHIGTAKSGEKAPIVGTSNKPVKTEVPSNNKENKPAMGLRPEYTPTPEEKRTIKSSEGSPGKSVSTPAEKSTTEPSTGNTIKLTPTPTENNADRSSSDGSGNLTPKPSVPETESP